MLGLLQVVLRSSATNTLEMHNLPVPFSHNLHVAEGRPFYEVVACIDGRGFRERREDMRQMLLRLNGKVFTMATLDQLITHTRIREFVSAPA